MVPARRTSTCADAAIESCVTEFRAVGTPSVCAECLQLSHVADAEDDEFSRTPRRNADRGHQTPVGKIVSSHEDFVLSDARARLPS